jgi:restriction endonuclease S subunit
MTGRWVGGEFVFVSEAKADSLTANLAYPGDIIFTQRGTLGQVSMVPTLSYRRYLVSQSQMKLSVDRSKAHPLFVYYVFCSPGQQEYIRQNAIQTGVPHTNLGILRNTPLHLPDVHLQRQIADILGSLDDKIELNRRTNETLEAMARTLFRSWFVDFDPVRAKADGQQPTGLDAATAKLFPDSFEPSALGPIPKGWRVGSILEQSDLISGGTPNTSVPGYWDGNIPWASAKDVSQCGQPFLIETERRITESGLENSSTKVLPAWATVIVARGATTGRMTMFGGNIAMNQTCYGLRSKVEANATLYCQLQDGVDRLVHAAHGSVFDTITTRTFQTSQFLLPSEPVLKAFEARIRPLFECIRCRLHESRTLAATRDALLPKLVSGEITP